MARVAEAEWARVELGAADWGDERRTARLVERATVLGRRPQGWVPQARDDPY